MLLPVFVLFSPGVLLHGHRRRISARESSESGWYTNFNAFFGLRIFPWSGVLRFVCAVSYPVLDVVYREADFVAFDLLGDYIACVGDIT